MALTFTILSIEEITQAKGQHNVFQSSTELAPLVSYQPDGTLVIIARVANASNDSSNWHHEPLAVDPAPSGSNYVTQGVKIYYNDGSTSDTTSPTGVDYRIEVSTFGPVNPEVHLTVGVDGNMPTADPVRKTKVILSSTT